MTSLYTTSELRKVRDLGGKILKADSARGEVTAFVNSTGVVDRQKDVMEVGCWRKVIDEGQQPSICLGHDVSRVVGKVIEMEEVNEPLRKGLLIKGLFAMDTRDGHDAFVLVSGGFVKQWSVQFTSKDEEVDTKQGIRHINLVDELFEVSPVLVGASPSTMTLATKAAYERTATLSRHESLRRIADLSDDIALQAVKQHFGQDQSETTRRWAPPAAEPANPAPTLTRSQVEFETAMARCYRDDPIGHADKAIFYQRAARRGAL